MTLDESTTNAREPDMDALVICARRMAACLSLEDVSDAELERKMNEILYGPRRFWDCANVGLITHEETARALITRLDAWLLHRASLPEDSTSPGMRMPELARDIEHALFGSVR